jgi:hypothetical protein
MRRLYGALVLTAALTLAGAAQKQPDASVGDIGPKIGQVAPDFEASDQHGVPRRLSSLLGPKGAMLVFYRSADW